MKVTVPLGPKIFTDIVMCESCGSEVTIWTDGHRAYAQCGNLFESTEGYREREKMTIRCGYTNIRSGEICDGLVEFDLTEPAWVKVTPEILNLMSHAESIEVTR